MLTALLVGAINTPAHADRLSTVTMEQVQQDIRAQIQYGLAHGLITPAEARTFYQRERTIQSRDMRFRKNPHASRHERDAIWRDLDIMRVDVERKLNRHGQHGQRTDASSNLLQRQMRIDHLINQGIASGLIDQEEARWLQQQQRDISRREAGLQANGELTRFERNRLHRDLDALEWEVNRLLDRTTYQFHQENR